MTQADVQYHKLLKYVLDNGVEKTTRSGDVLSTYGGFMRFDLGSCFPLLTTKKMFHRGVLEELLWFISGSTNIKPLVDKGVHIWDDDAYRYYKQLFPRSNLTKEWFIEKVKNGETLLKYTMGDLGDVYGKNWRSYGDKGIDQLAEVIRLIKDDSSSRRILLDAYNPETASKAALPPCHLLYQFVVQGEKLGCVFYCRSSDVFLGLPFNIASAAFLTHMIAHVCGLGVGDLVYCGGDVHLYLGHIEAANEQLSRSGSDKSPILMINRDVGCIDDFRTDDFTIIDYEPDGVIKAPLFVGT